MLINECEKTKEPTAHNQPTTNEQPTQGNKTCNSTLCTVAVAILISAFAASYILADNRLPLACTGIAESDRVVQDKIRLGMWGATVFFGILVIICWCCYVHKMR